MGDHDVLLENAVCIGGLEFAGLQFGIDESSRGTKQAKLQRDQLAVERHVRLDQVFGIESPAFGVGAVEGVADAGDGDAVLEHGIELQFVAGTGFVSGERPGRGVESEVVVFFGCALAGRGGDVQGKNELAFLSGVVQKGRRLHVGRGLLRGFGGGRDANSRGAIGQRDDLVIGDDLLDLLQAIFVEGQDRVADELLLF